MRWVLLLQGIGVAGRYFYSANETESDVYGLLYFDLSWPESLAQNIDDGGAIICLIVGTTVFIAGVVYSQLGKLRERTLTERTLRGLQAWLPLVAASWMLTLATTHLVRGDVYAEFSLGEHAVRFVLPISLSLLFFQRPFFHKTAVILLVAACSATFLVHGYKAIKLYGPFTDLLLLTDARLLGLGFEQNFAERALLVIGIVDVVGALLLLVTRWRWILIYMVIWGFITALSRMTAMGWPAWPETLIRAANCGAPLALLLYYGTRLKSERSIN